MIFEDIYNKRFLLTENSINSANSSLIELKDRSLFISNKRLK